MTAPDKTGAAPAPKKKRKKSNHPLSHAREIAMQGLYQLELGAQKLDAVLRFAWLNSEPDATRKEYARFLIQQVDQNKGSLDLVIRVHSRVDHSQISLLVRTLLRMAVYELQENKIPTAIVIDEYLQLTRIYDGEDSVAFVHALLDSWEKEKVPPQN